MKIYYLVSLEIDTDAPNAVKTSAVSVTTDKATHDLFISAGQARLQAGDKVKAAQFFIPRIPAGRPGRKVRVTAVSEDSMISGLEVGEVYESAQALTMIFRSQGYSGSYNVVAVKLGAVRHQPDPGERVAKYAGVSFMYEDDYMQNIFNHARD